MERCAYLRLAVVAIILLTTRSLAAQATPDTSLRVVVTMDDRPYLGADVVIKPIDSPEGWPTGKTQIKLLTNAKGLARVKLGPGTYRVTAKGGGRLPATGRITIKPGQAKPAEVRLVLQYWDCSVVTCTL
jgi:hypothetical protein